MRLIKLLVMAALFIGLSGPALAQTDPHHPEGDATPAVADMPAGNTQPAVPPPGNATTQCPDMMGMMQGGGTLMPTMQMHMMAMMQMHMQLMQQMQGGMMQPGSSQMQMMAMMQSMQMMQMDLMQMMQRMRNDTAAPEGSTEGAKP